MDRTGGDPHLLKPAGNPVGTVFRAGEDQDHGKALILQEMQEQTRLEMLRDLINRLGDGIGGIGTSADLNGLGILQKLPGQLLDLTRQGGREEKGLPFPREQFHDLTDRRNKPHVEHSVGFVEHKELDVSECLLAAADDVEKPARGCDHDVGTLLKRLDLGTLADSAEDGGHGQGKMLGIGTDILLDLDDKLARRGDHQRPDSPGWGGCEHGEDG